jgi:hypothetical protein
MDDEVKKLLQEANAVLDVPFEPSPLGKGALLKVRGQVQARIRFYEEMATRGLHVPGGIESGSALLRVIDNYLRVAERPEPDPSPEEWWRAVMNEARDRASDNE